MRRASLYRMSGNSLMISALLFALAIALVPKSPAANIEEAARLIGGRSAIVGILAMLGAVLSLTAMIGVYRHFMDGEHEPWAMLALGGSICGTTLAVLAGALVALGQPMLLGMAQGTLYDPAYVALAVTFRTAMLLSGTLMWLSLLAIGFAMLKDPVWPRWIVRGAAVVGALEAIAPFALLGAPRFSGLVTILGFAYLVFLGNAITRLPKTAPAPAPQPAVTV